MEANPGADMMLSEVDVNEQLISDSRIFHFGSLSMTGEICEAATKKAVNAAKKNGLIISSDPNLRENLWDSLDKAREKIEYGIANCDILKATPHKDRLTALRTPCLHLFRHIAPKLLEIRGLPCGGGVT